jgi:hypothetical protein
LVFVVEFECRKIPAIAADLTLGPLVLDQYFLPDSTALLLRNVRLMTIIGI